MNLKSILNSKYFYYLAIFFLVVNMLGYVSMGAIECVLVFGVVAYAANHFTKNKAIDIFAGLFASNILFGCGRIKEGFEPVDEKLQKCANELTKKACDKNDQCNWDDDKGQCIRKLKEAAKKANEASAITQKAEADLANISEESKQVEEALKLKMI